jgi:membrane-associated protein
MQVFFRQFWDIIITLFDPRNLTNPEAFKLALNQPGVFLAAMTAIACIIFTETGLFVGIFLPGDSLLVTAGLVARLSDWPIQFFIPVLCIAGILGDSTGYWIGRKFGYRLYQKKDTFYFKQKYLKAAHDYYEKKGGWTIILAKFVPIVRTFVPVVAGISQMPYRRFAVYSVTGVLTWIPSMVLIGYTLQDWLDPLLEKIFGRKVEVARNIDKLIFVVVIISILPIIYKGYIGWRAKRLATSISQTSVPSPPA